MASTTFTSGTLTANYADNRQVVQVSQGPVVLLVDYTNGSEASMELQLEISDDNTTFYLPVTSQGSAISELVSLSATSSVRLAVAGRGNATDIEYIGSLVSGEQYIRISAKASTPGGGPGSVVVKVLHNPAPASSGY